MPYCKYCGSAVDSDAVFCSSCGKQLASKASPAPAAPREPQPPAPVTKRGDVIPAEDLMKPDPEKVQAYMKKVTGYVMAMSMLNQFYNTLDEWSDYDLEMWAEMEEVMRKKYELPEISLYRRLKPERYEKKEPQPERRRNRTYTKRNTEYWQKYEKKNEGGE